MLYKDLTPSDQAIVDRHIERTSTVLLRDLESRPAHIPLERFHLTNVELPRQDRSEVIWTAFAVKRRQKNKEMVNTKNFEALFNWDEGAK